jgi:hypothetical protein
MLLAASSPLPRPTAMLLELTSQDKYKAMTPEGAGHLEKLAIHLHALPDVYQCGTGDPLW